MPRTPQGECANRSANRLFAGEMTLKRDRMHARSVGRRQLGELLLRSRVRACHLLWRAVREQHWSNAHAHARLLVLTQSAHFALLGRLEQAERGLLGILWPPHALPARSQPVPSMV